MSKMASLQAGLDRAANTRGAAGAPSAPPLSSQPDVPASTPAPSAKAQTGNGKVHVGAYLPRGFRQGMRLVQAQTGEDTQTLLARALNDHPGSQCAGHRSGIAIHPLSANYRVTERRSLRRCFSPSPLRIFRSIPANRCLERSFATGAEPRRPTGAFSPDCRHQTPSFAGNRAGGFH